jgi:hypothetical protein
MVSEHTILPRVRVESFEGLWIRPMTASSFLFAQIMEPLFREPARPSPQYEYGKDFAMITEENARRKKVPGRTIIMAIVMLAGVVLMGYGYFQSERLMVYAGIVITLSGVMTEAIFGVIGSMRDRRRGRMAGV